LTPCFQESFSNDLRSATATVEEALNGLLGAIETLTSGIDVERGDDADVHISAIFGGLSLVENGGQENSKDGRSALIVGQRDAARAVNDSYAATKREMQNVIKNKLSYLRGLKW